MGLTTRLDWPDGSRWLAAARAKKGFSVVQIIAGPYPDMDAWDPRGRNEAGFPFQGRRWGGRGGGCPQRGHQNRSDFESMSPVHDVLDIPIER